MNTWLAAINQKLDTLRGKFILPYEENLVDLTFCDGHAVHVTTLADMRGAAAALNHKWESALRDSENGSPAQVKQEIVALMGYVVNAHRLS